TIEGLNFETFPGGKGANQAVATSRLGATVSMIGAVGNDSHGEMLVQNLKNNNVDISNVEVLSEEVSGTAFITVVNGDNSIIFIPGANEKIDYNKIEKTLQSHEDFDMFILQNEISQNVINLVIEFAHNHNILTLY